jgi:hypothetical protein
MSRLRVVFLIYVPACIAALLCCLVLALAAGLLASPAQAQDKSDVEGRTAAVAEYVAASVPGWADGESISTALIDAGENWPELAAALDHYAVDTQEADADQHSAYDCMVWLLVNAPHLDRLELTAEMLIGNLDLALADAGDFGYDTTTDFFRRNVLNYRLDDEPVTVWRPELNMRYTPPASGGDEPGNWLHMLGRAQKIIDYATRDFTVLERGYFGNLADPVSIDNARAGTTRELAMLTAAALRSQGFATRYVRENRSGESWVEVYIGPMWEYDTTRWVPVYPTEPDNTGDTDYAKELCGGRIAVVTAGDAFGMEQVTTRYTPVCEVRPMFLKPGTDGDLVELDDYEHWSLTAWDGTTYQPLDDLGYPVSEADYPLTYGEGVEERAGGSYYVGAPGAYQLQAGVRYPGGVIHVITSDFEAEPGGQETLIVSLVPPADLPLEALIDRRIPAELPAGLEFLAEGTRLYLVADTEEPSIRAAGALEFFSYDEDPDYGFIEYIQLSYATEDPDERRLIDEGLKVSEKDMLPVVVLIQDGETLLYQRGYNVNVRDWVFHALE